SSVANSPKHGHAYPLTRHGLGEGVEEDLDALEEPWPPDHDARGNLLGRDAEEGNDGQDAELLVVDPGEGRHAPEPQAEELVRPALGLEDLEGEVGVVVDGVDDHLHQVDLVRLELD